jgi:hypothetical protein
MMAHLWVYEGELDPAGTSLTLHTGGPSYEDETRIARYRDVIRLESDDERTLTSSYEGSDGRWHTFMTSRYRRVRPS